MRMKSPKFASQAGVLVAPAGGRDCDAAADAADPRHAFLRMAWFDAASAQGATPIGVFRPSGEPIAVIPLRPGDRALMGPRHVAGSYWPFRSFPIARDSSDDELLAMLRNPDVRSALGRAWRLGPVLANDPTAARLLRLAPLGGWTVLKRRLGTCYELDLAAVRAAGPWPRPSTRKKIRWHERRLADHGMLSYRFLTGNDLTGRDFDSLAAIEAHSWLGRADRAADTKFLDCGRRQFWERIADQDILAPMLYCSTLTVGKAPVAFTFGLEVANMRYQIANSYDERFAGHSPGKLLLWKDFERAAERGVERISWGAGDPGYKSEMGAAPGPEILDLLFVRGAPLAAVLRVPWTRTLRKA